MNEVARAEPRLVFLFSGHMIDQFDRSTPRFPTEREGTVAVRIFEVLESLGAQPPDLGICGGAAGGDLLFAEACLGRGLGLEVLLPQPLESFVAASVAPSGTGWRQRFEAVVRAASVRTEVLDGDYLAQGGLGLHARHCRWLLDRALAWGSEKLRFVALWDGQPGDGAGGTADMVEAVRRHTDRIHLIRPD